MLQGKIAVRRHHKELCHALIGVQGIKNRIHPPRLHVQEFRVTFLPFALEGSEAGDQKGERQNKASHHPSKLGNPIRQALTGTRMFLTQSSSFIIINRKKNQRFENPNVHIKKTRLKAVTGAPLFLFKDMRDATSTPFRTLLLACFFLSFFVVNAQPPRMLAFEYIDKHKELALQQMLRHRIPASVILAQAIFESGYGKSELAKRSNNHFGIKCHLTW